MLVYVHRGLLLKGKATIKTYKHWYSRAVEKYMDITCGTGVSGICDADSIDQFVADGLQKELASSGWGNDFSGWTDYEWTTELRVEHVSQWKMDRIIKQLTGEQFAKEFGFQVPDQR